MLTVSFCVFDKFLEKRFLQIFIGNEWLPSSRARTFPTFNPATGVKICDVEEADRVRRQAVATLLAQI